jgi:hypothetical protein
MITFQKLVFPLQIFRMESERPAVNVDSMSPERPLATLCCSLLTSESPVSRDFVINLKLGSYKMQLSATVPVDMNLSYIHKLISLEIGKSQKR